MTRKRHRKGSLALIVAAASALLLGLVLAAPASAAAATPMIIDQDMFSSADDVGALATAFSLEHAGEANVIAITLNTRTSRPVVANDTFKCAAAIENFYGSHAPIGTQTPLGDPTPNAPDFVGPCGQLAPAGAAPSGDAVSVMTQALKAQADNSVVIVCTGYERNLDDLLQSPGGAALVAQKVSRLVVMGGGYMPQPGGTTFGSPGENNFNGDIAAAQDVAAHWPTKIVYSGAEVGDVVHSGAGISGSHPHYSPVRVAYEAFVGENNYIDSHDLTAVYEAIRPNTLLTENGPGTNVVSDLKDDPNNPTWDYGANVFTMDPTGHHSFLTVPAPTALESSLDGLLDYTPAPTGITAPANSAAPRIFDTAQPGTLIASPGSWTGTPTAFAYQWQDCSPSGTCTPISQAIHQTYDMNLNPVSAGHTIKVHVWASIPGASSAVAESGAGPVPAKTKTDLPATISGIAQEGQTLAASAGTWTNSPTGYTYQWQRCTSGACSPIAGAISQHYTLTSSDVNQTISVQVTANNAGGSSDPVVSNATPIVLPAVPLTAVGPSISPPGSVVEGQTLTESHAPWSPIPTSFGYQWQSCDVSGNSCSSIPGATSQSYRLTAGDVGHTLRVQETATNAGGVSSPATSKPTGVVTAAPTVTPPVPPTGSTVTPPPPPSGTGPSGSALVSSAQIRAMLTKAMAVQGPGGKLRAVVKQGGYSFTATAPSAGRLTISWYTKSRGKKVLVAKVTFAFQHSGIKKMKLTLTANGRKLLGATGKMTITVNAAFTPSGQSTTSMTKMLTLRR